ncbi:hypothetical protein AVEN_85465-1, partial [Araneus ventricosus]
QQPETPADNQGEKIAGTPMQLDYLSCHIGDILQLTRKLIPNTHCTSVSYSKHPLCVGARYLKNRVSKTYEISELGLEMSESTAGRRCRQVPSCPCVLGGAALRRSMDLDRTTSARSVC